MANNTTDRPRDKFATSWDILKLPIKIQGAERRSALLLGGELAMLSTWLGCLLGIVFYVTDSGIDRDFFAGFLIFGIATFLTLVSIVSVYSIFVYREIQRKGDTYKEATRHLASSLGVDLGPFEVDDPINSQVISKIKAVSSPKMEFEWITFHRMQQIQDVLAFFMRHTHERVMLITASLVLPGLAFLPFSLWIPMVSPLAVGVLAYVTLFSLWAVYETLTFIFITLKIVNDKWVVLQSVVDGDDKYTLIAPMVSDRHYLPH